MVYQWKVGNFYNINAQEAGEEIERMTKTGAVTPRRIVEESIPDEAVLHGCFEWDDEKAAGLYREYEAASLLRNIVTVNIEGAELQEPVRAFVCIQNDYKPIDIVIKTEVYKEELLQKAIAELKSFQRKYASLSSLSEVFMAIDSIDNVEQMAI